MANKIICIAREFGSGGHEIAVRTGSKLGIRVYEKDLFHLACKYGELSEKMMESADETATNLYLFRTVHEGNYHVTRGLPTSEVLFQLQSHEIRKIAQQESCIFVGRCADFCTPGRRCQDTESFCPGAGRMAHQAKNAARTPQSRKGSASCPQNG